MDNLFAPPIPMFLGEWGGQIESDPMRSTLVLASHNTGKLREFSALLGPLGLTIVPQSQLGVPEAEEPFGTFLENALAKARHASRLTGLPALADDSGLCVDALGGVPGIHSARFAGEPKSDARNNAKLLDELAKQPNRRGHYYCVLVLVRHPDDPPADCGGWTVAWRNFDRPQRRWWLWLRPPVSRLGANRLGSRDGCPA